jgi:hypothetical protein
VGRFSKGKRAPERKNIGITRKFITKGKALISSNKEAMAVPKAVKNRAISTMNKKAKGKNMDISGLKPIIEAKTKITTPCITPIVAAPNVLPVIMVSLDTGATNISFKNPDRLSQIRSIPVNTEVKRMLIAIMPGPKN